MNNLTTRKIVLGMLMALVLTFSVQGIADALTFTQPAAGTKRVGDLQRLKAGDEFVITFSLTLSPSAEVNTGTQLGNSSITGYTATAPYFYLRAPTDPNSRVWLSEAAAYYFNEQAIMINPTGVTILRIGTRNVAVSEQAGITLSQLDKWSDGTTRLPGGQISVTCKTAGTGRHTIDVEDATQTNDRMRNGATIPKDEFGDPFIVYVWQLEGTSRSSRISGGGGLTTPNIVTNDDQAISVMLNSAWARVGFEVYEGPGTLYEDKDTKNGPDDSPARELVAFTNNHGGINNDAQVYLRANNGTSKVRAWVYGNSRTLDDDTITSEAAYIYRWSTLTKVSGDDPPLQRGLTGSQLESPFVVEVQDANSQSVSGVDIDFGVGEGRGTLQEDPGFPADLYDDDFSVNGMVETNSSGRANVFLALGDTPGPQTVTARFGGATVTFTATAGTAVVTNAASIEKDDGDGQSAATNKPLTDPLVVIVRDRGGLILSEVQVRFVTDSGALSFQSGDPGTYVTATNDERGITVSTDLTGRAAVRYNVGNVPGAKNVHAEIEAYDGQSRRTTFNINGSGSISRPPVDEDDTPPPVSANVPSSVSGAAGSSQTLTITAPAAATVTVGVPADTFPFGSASAPARSGTTVTSTLTLPSQIGPYSLSVYVNTTRHPVTVTVTAAAAQAGSTLSVRINPASGAPGSTATVTVTAINADGTAAPNITVTLRITPGGGTFSPSTVTTGANGTATSTLTRGSTVGSNYFVTASTTSGYTQVSALSSGERVLISRASSERAVGEAAEVDVYDGNNQDGSLNSRLAEPLVVEVVDANDNPVEDARVRFRTTIGSGRFSPRTPRTDEDGFAETTFTPTSPGRIRISASVAGVDDRAAFTVQAGDPADALVKVSGDDQSGTPGNGLASPFVVEVQDEDGEPLSGHSVTFSVTAGGGSLSETSATTNANGRAQTTLTLGSAPGINSVQASVSGVDPVTFSTNIEPKIRVAAANRPVMYWIDNGMLYSLAGAKAAKIAESANGVAVSGGKIYWTSQINPSSGTINSANLDGTDAATLASIKSVPIGIAVDTAGSKLYWTNARGRIQSANLNGSGIQNVLQNLSAPTDIVVSNGFIYWTEGGNSVRRVNMSGQKIAIDVAVNLDSVGGLAVGSGKVYWTEMTSATAGTVNGANLNGTNFKTLATLRSAPMGISVDTAGSKLYWTNARGRVQSANLDGSMIKNVVEGLISPSKLTIGGANTATTTTAKKATTPAKKDNAAYDVNGDGAVDNTDASLVAAAMNTSNTKYDVNGDGTVNFLDLLLVFDNREDAAAAAPTIVGMKLTAIQIDIIQEQIDLLIATNDRSPAALRTLVYMQQLLATARPEKTQLFANYPNPFNPETWIPYELATDTHVRITIYNTQGVVIRTLQFGHQSAGYYTGRDRAAYWDGRNAFGEQVASGVYFYQLETDEMSSMRKMVILK